MSATVRWVAHLDVDAFFASIEQRDNPHLRGRPVAVGTGVVASCSYEARRLGVRTAMRLSDARRACPSLVVVPGDYRRYEIAGRRILGIASDHVARIEPAALDDLYLDLGARSQHDAVAVSRTIARNVRQELALRVSIGVGPNRLLASVVTDEVKRRKARGLTDDDVAVVPPGREREYLAPLPADVLPGVGHKTADQLARLNVRTVAQVAEMPVSVLVGLFGERGRVFRELARGFDHRDVNPEKKPQSVSRSTSFDPAVGDPDVLTAMTDHLAERLGLWLRTHDLSAKALTVHVRHADHRGESYRALFDGFTDDDTRIKRAARDRLGRMTGRRVPLRLVGLELSPLAAKGRQGELFAEEEAEKARRLREAKDAIRTRFGFMAVHSGSSLELNEHMDHDRDNYRLRTPCLTR